MSKPRSSRASLAVALALVSAGACSPSRSGVPAGDAAPRRREAFHRQDPFEVRPLRLDVGDRWIGSGVAYGPHRDGQHPGGPSPSREQIREDLRLLAERWQLLRLYGAVGPAGTVLEVIRAERFPMKVMLGAWIDVEQRRNESGRIVEESAEKHAANRREIDAVVELANAHRDIVIGVCVGNETQVFWSAHRSPPENLIDYVREVRARVTTPVTVADDFNFWNKPESHAVAREVDFIVAHIHPLWNGLALDQALEWTQATFAALQAEHSGHLLVLGETGWATRRHTEGEQARLIKGEPGEEQQQIFYDALTAWVDKARVPTFFFEAFDENWKGGPHPDEVEKHWGLYRADRTPKKAVAEI